MRTALALAMHAPSTYNTQPWHWQVGPDRVDLYADRNRHLPQADPDGRDLILSCGAALHHCTVALAALGWHAAVHRFPDPAVPHHLASLTVEPQSPGDVDVMLAAAIPRRRTDRRTYSDWPVPWGDVALMGARAARSGVMLRQIELPPGQNNGVMMALGTENDDCLARLRAGEATSLVLLSATAMGLASCPVTEPLEVPETREAVRADVFGASGHPQMLVRAGWAPVNADPLPPTPRRPLGEVTDWLQDWPQDRLQEDASVPGSHCGADCKGGTENCSRTCSRGKWAIER